MNLSKIDLHKKNLGIVLEKKKIINVKAKVGLALDVTGSMRKMYKEGIVQNVVEKILAIANKFDDDGELDVWIYDHRFKKLPSISENDFEGFVEREILTLKEIFGHNFECHVMKDIYKFYTGQEYPENFVNSKDPSFNKANSEIITNKFSICKFIKNIFQKKSEKIIEIDNNIPAFLIFISDGGCKNYKKCIEKIIIKSSEYPIFWQFVGIGKSTYGIFEKLDTLEGRIVDNTSFFSLDDIDTISDNELYERLLNEFPEWLKIAKEKNIVS